MRAFLAAAVAVSALGATGARAQERVIALGDGWTVRFPCEPTKVRVVDETPWGRGALDGWNGASEHGAFSALSGALPRAPGGEADAEAELRRRVELLRRRLAQDGEVRVVEASRQDPPGAVGLEVRLALLRTDGRALRVHSRLVQHGARFLQAMYAAERDGYAGEVAKAFLHSLTRDDPRAAVGRGGVEDNGRIVREAAGKGGPARVLGDADLAEAQAALAAYRGDRSKAAFDRAFAALRRCYVIDTEMARQRAFFTRYADAVTAAVERDPELARSELKLYLNYLAVDLQDTEVPELEAKGRRLAAKLAGR